MRELPILFSTDMVKAILDGRKTQTRRIVKPHIVDRFIYDPNGRLLGSYIEGEGDGYPTIDDSPYQIGDKLYVRETWNGIRFGTGKTEYWYKADEPEDADTGVLRERWRPSIHMPKEAARIWLEVTDVRVERVQEITLQDILSEGVEVDTCRECFEQYGTPCCFDVDSECGLYKESYMDFENLWDSTIKKQDLPLYGWYANPWVRIYEFKRLEGQV